ncbi:MAG: beta-ketoacyl-ACP synthase II [Planctomycetaceae bacterium]|nr:beta-ketoacyl-ACP synthase II [Planctomycetaceae bacterium]
MKERVVVTGMGVISAIGIGLEEFWSGIKAGKPGIAPITRFDTKDVPCKVAGEVKNYEPKQWLDHRTIQRSAHFAQFAMIAALEAWKHAGLSKEMFDAAPERCAIILGNGIGGLEADNDAQRKLVEKGASRIPAMTIPKIIGNEAAGNISMLLGIRGLSHTIITACASGTDAIGHALYYIQNGYADVVVTGGTEAAVTEYAIGGFCALKALSTGFNETPERASRPFDKKRDGFVMGEGAGILILESLTHAQKRNAGIYAEIAGFSATSDAYHLTAPDPQGSGATHAIRLALTEAGMKPEEVDYINAHGTSTPTNDPIETLAIKNAFGDHAYKLKVSSTKGMTGHCIGAAGGIEAVISVKAMEEGFYPPTINLEEPDPACDLDYVPNVGKTGNIRAAVSISLGFGGHNSVIVMKKWE